MKDVLAHLSGFAAAPKEGTFVLNAEFVLWVHQAAACARVAMLQRAFSSGGHIEPKPNLIVETVRKCPHRKVAHTGFEVLDFTCPETIVS